MVKEVLLQRKHHEPVYPIHMRVQNGKYDMDQYRDNESIVTKELLRVRHAQCVETL
jgi:hypothetical protein